MANIQIIDDDVELAENVSSALKASGHETSLLDNVEQAIDVLTSNKPDLLILDVMFPGNDAGGFDLARKIRTTDGIKDLRVIMLTGVNQEFPMDFSPKDIDPDWMPVQAFMEKPVNLEKLIEKVSSILAG